VKNPVLLNQVNYGINGGNMIINVKNSH